MPSERQQNFLEVVKLTIWLILKKGGINWSGNTKWPEKTQTTTEVDKAVALFRSTSKRQFHEKECRGFTITCKPLKNKKV